MEVAGTGAAGHIEWAGGPIGFQSRTPGVAEPSGGYRRFPGMNKFDQYRPKLDVALIMLMVAVISVVGLFAIEIENPRLSHFPQPPSPETRAAAAEAGARVTPTHPDEVRTDQPRRPNVVDNRTAE